VNTDNHESDIELPKTISEVETKEEVKEEIKDELSVGVIKQDKQTEVKEEPKKKGFDLTEKNVRNIIKIYLVVSIIYSIYKIIVSVMDVISFETFEVWNIVGVIFNVGLAFLSITIYYYFFMFITSNELISEKNVDRLNKIERLCGTTIIIGIASLMVFAISTAVTNLGLDVMNVFAIFIMSILSEALIKISLEKNK